MQYKNIKIIILLILVPLFVMQNLVAQELRAFPGAEGAGAYASGGRDGDLYFVTNLNDSGPGSFREGIDTTPLEGRTILFRVGGYIHLETGIQINRENITIAGQTAPGDGICIKNSTLYIGDRPPRKTGQMLGNNIIIRHIRMRLGISTQTTDHTDNMWICNGRNIILDHVSSSWSSDEVLSASRDVQTLTVQHTLLYEPLNAEGHGFGSIIGSGFATDFSWHHVLYAHCTSRNPRPSSDPPDPSGFNLDFRNNVIYNPGRRIGYNSGDRVNYNYVGNYIIAGPNTSEDCVQDSGGTTYIYQSGNLRDMNENGIPDGTDDGWGMFCGSYDRLSSPHDVPPVTTDSAGDAYIRVLALGGAMPWNRDATDKRVIDTVINESGRIINEVSDVGGYQPMDPGTPPDDSDNDGMPDYWELAMGLDPSNPEDRKNKDLIGYTMLDGYLNWLGDGHALCDRNASVDVSLRDQNGGLTFLNYSVTSGTNGTVTLLSDGYTARFTAVPDYSGLADFTYTATDPRTGYGIGPIKVGVLITGTGTQPTPPPTENCGDVNEDEVADILDALLVAQCYVGLISCPSATIGDVNCDEQIDILDALLIAQFYVGLVDVLFCCGPTPTATPEITPTPTPVPFNPEMQAEDATWSSGGVESDHSGYTGTGYVNTDNASGEWIEWTVDVAAGSNATCVFRYACASDARPMALSVNGTTITNLGFPASGAWDSWATETANVILSAGRNAIRLTATASGGAPNMDKMDINIED